MSGHEVCDTKIQAVAKEVADGFRRQELVDAEILAQVKKTNGRVSSLELWKARLIAAVSTLGLAYGGPDIIHSIIKFIAQ